MVVMTRRRSPTWIAWNHLLPSIYFVTSIVYVFAPHVFTNDGLDYLLDTSDILCYTSHHTCTLEERGGYTTGITQGNFWGSKDSERSNIFPNVYQTVSERFGIQIVRIFAEHVRKVSTWNPPAGHVNPGSFSSLVDSAMSAWQSPRNSSVFIAAICIM